MPIYEYECKNCQKTFEAIKPLAKREKTACPDCGKSARRVLSNFAVGNGGAQPTGATACDMRDSCASRGAGCKAYDRQ